MRKLREYKGIVFDPAKERWRSRNWSYESAAEAIVSPYSRLTDDDHAALMDLKANPYEPTPTLDSVLQDWYISRSSSLSDLRERLRAAFPHIDQEER